MSRLEKVEKAITVASKASMKLSELERFKVAECLSSALDEVLPPLQVDDYMLEIIEDMIEHHSCINPRLLLLSSVRRVVISNIFESISEKKPLSNLCAILSGFDMMHMDVNIATSLIHDYHTLEAKYESLISERQQSGGLEEKEIVEDPEMQDDETNKPSHDITVLVYNETANEYCVGEWRRLRNGLKLVHKNPNNPKLGWKVASLTSVKKKGSGTKTISRWNPTDVIKTMREDYSKYDEVKEWIEMKKLANFVRIEDIRE